jgi:nucleoid-associated protein EbfC
MNEGPDLNALLETAQRIQNEVSRLKDELGNRTVEGETGGGLIRCVSNGRGELLSLDVDPALLDVGKKKMLQDLIVGAVNLATDRAKTLAQEELAKATGGLPIPPGLFGGG